MYTKIGYQDFNNQRFRNIFVRSNEILCFPSFFIGVSDPRKVNRQNEILPSGMHGGDLGAPTGGSHFAVAARFVVSSRTISSSPPRRTLKKNHPIDEKQAYSIA